MASSALPFAAAAVLFLLLAPLLASAESPISLPPASSSSPTASPADHHLYPDSDSTPADAALAPSQPPSEASSSAALSPPAPPQTSPLPAPSESPVPHSAAPAPSPMEHPAASAPAPSAANKDDEGDDDDDKDKEEHSSTPAPAPSAEEIKAAAAGDKAPEEDGETERHGDELNGGKKAGVVVGAFSAAAVVGLAVVVWKKRQANIRRSRYADYSARLELV